MKKILIAFILTPAALMAYDPPLQTSRLAAPLDGWLFVGQSNMVGTSSGNTTIYTPDRHDAYLPVWKRAGTDPVAMPSEVETLATTGTFRGAEHGFMRRLHEIGNTRIIGLKHASNGKALYAWWLPGNDGYANLMASIAEFEADIAPQTVRWRGILWIQGTSDAVNTLAVANAYQSNLGIFLAQLRSDLATPDLVFVSPEHPPDWSTAAHASTVKAAVTAFCAADPRAVSYDADDTTTRDAGTHYQDSDGSFELLGILAADAYLENFAD